MKNKLSFKLKFLLSGSLITTSSLTLLTAAACGSTDPDQKNKLTVYDSLLTSVNKFYKNTYKDYEKNTITLVLLRFLMTKLITMLTKLISCITSAQWFILMQV